MQDEKDKLFKNFKSQKLQVPKFFLEAREANLGLILHWKILFIV